MNDDPSPDEYTPELDDADLASLLADHHIDENVQRTAQLVAAFYTHLRSQIDPVMTSEGDIHDAALELTREWMTYTMGEL